MSIKKILQAYDLSGEDYIAEPFDTGLVNHTWKISFPNGSKSYVLQRVNDSVFTKPFDIADNIRHIEQYLESHYPEYLFVSPLPTSSFQYMVCDPESGYYRLFPFIEDSRSFNVVHTPGQAHEASKQFALFTKLLSGFDVGMLKTTIPDFHNLSFRYEQFTEALSNGNPKRMQESSALIRFLIKQNTILRTYEMILRHPDFKRRVMHHDTKISNVLFNSENKALCLIDLDTVMPGYFISDVGDMLRTYLSPAGEEEDDFQKIQIREDFFEAILSGYLLELQDSLTKAEKAHFLYAGKFMIYMQALRFLTDYLNNDAYYKTNYEGHNLIRAQNQSVLLQRLLEKEPGLNKIINNVLSLTRS